MATNSEHLQHDADVIDLNEVRLARAVAAIEVVAEWCGRRAAEPPGDHEGDELGAGWEAGLIDLGTRLFAINRLCVPNDALRAHRVMMARVEETMRWLSDERETALETNGFPAAIMRAEGRALALTEGEARLRQLLKLPRPARATG